MKAEKEEEKSEDSQVREGVTDVVTDSATEDTADDINAFVEKGVELKDTISCSCTVGMPVVSTEKVTTMASYSTVISKRFTLSTNFRQKLLCDQLG